jgi:uncharacterized protein YndB with AHSA1/START domain
MIYPQEATAMPGMGTGGLEPLRGEADLAIADHSSSHSASDEDPPRTSEGEVEGSTHMTGLVATAEVDIDAAPERVWTALTDPAQIRAYMFGTNIETDWTVGSPIVWKGEWEGKPYEDKGEIIEIAPNRRLTVTHFSPLSGQPDVPGNYHTLTYELARRGNTTHVSLSQDNNPNQEAVQHSQRNWQFMLQSLKEYIERG